MIVKSVAAYLFQPKGVKFVDVGYAAAQHHGIGVEDRDQAAQAAAEIIQKLFEGDGALIIVALAVCSDNLLQGEPPPGLAKK